MFHADKEQFKNRLEKIKTINLARLTVRVVFFIVFCNAKPFNSSAKSTIIKIFESIMKKGATECDMLIHRVKLPTFIYF